MLIYSIPVAFGLVGCVFYYSPYVWRLRRVSDLRQRAIRERMLVLTYDDGPSSSTTPAVLQLLKQHNAKATFFMLGQNAQRNPSIADRIVNEGHEVGCHSQQHLNAWKVSPWRATADIRTGYNTLLSWVPGDGMYRPPYGKMTFPTYWAIRRRGAHVGWWTIDSGDVRSPLPEPRQVVDLLLCEGGGIILMHDLDRSLERNDFVLETTALLLETATRESFQVGRLSALCQ